MDKRRCYWVRLKEVCPQTIIRLTSFGVSVRKHNYPLKICEAISFDNQRIAVVVDTTIGVIDIPICILMEDVEPLSVRELSKMDFLDKETKRKVAEDIFKY
jgi:hypothetical protein